MGQRKRGVGQENPGIPGGGEKNKNYVEYILGGQHVVSENVSPVAKTVEYASLSHRASRKEIQRQDY